MKMNTIGKALIALVLFTIVSPDTQSQLRITYGLESPTFTLAHEDTDKYDVLDSCYLTVTYKFSFRSYEKDDSLNFYDMMNLEMGTGYNAFYSKDLRKIDIANTREMKKGLQLICPPEESVGFDILTDHAGKVMTVTNRIPYTTEVIEYEEQIPELDWKYSSNETDSVMGYVCKVAECSYGGRKWKVWYTDEIPVPYGPWKLNGTRGLVLKAADTENNFVFTAEGLTQKAEPIVRYSWPRKRMEKEAWKKFESDMYANAGAFVRNTGANIIIMDNSERGYHKLKEDWSQYYNPLER